MAHHGEIFQGVVRAETGRLRRALCSLPCSGLGSDAVFRLDDSGIVTVTPPWKTKASLAARLVLERIGRPDLGGTLEVRSEIPPGWGLGSSTADVIASIRAVIASVPQDLRLPSIAALAVQAERASDSTIFNNSAVLFAHREGEVVEFLGGQIPELIVVGFNTDSEGVDTLDFPPARYVAAEIDQFADLVDLLRRAIRDQDVRALSQVATGCARINQSHLPKRCFDRIEEIATEVGALGVQVAHSGTVAGLLFDPRDPETDLRCAQASAQLAELGFGGAWRFSTVQSEPLRLRSVL